MRDDEVLEECKIGLSISLDNLAFDRVLSQKILAVKSFMRNAGVSEAKMNEDDLALGVIVMGVADLWQTGGGEVKFSSAFQTIVNQLTYDDEEV
ncbi:hypothetical protein J7E79_02720 [Bacillus sp. ISL-40]|uniref:hypothetical protein n=1 Tax=unclassified Bacillus (in: firmicutes) TaxID=185979 RepID=UPI001BE820FB|nr:MULTISPECIES: hypothetical protein [unclassified Bacillus (in: firmicutes)]MBT2696349.1 hypothetical protein [Bacillus sp. ISL-40]MBT2743198.1 hypothetical protein [Bacillus sp. ISL-77]